MDAEQISQTQAQEDLRQLRLAVDARIAQGDPIFAILMSLRMRLELIYLLWAEITQEAQAHTEHLLSEGVNEFEARARGLAIGLSLAVNYVEGSSLAQ